MGVAIHDNLHNGAFSPFERKDSPLALHLVPRSLKYLDGVAQIGSIQGASRELGVAASAINRQILLLEETLGVKLFERHPAGMTPTAAGEAFLVLARRWSKDVDRLVSEIKQLQGLDLGHVRIAAMDSMANGVLPRFIERATQTIPRVQIEIEIMSPHQAIVALDQGIVDVAVAFNVKPRSDLHLVSSAELPLGCVVSPRHPLAGSRSATLKAVACYPLALQSRSLAVRRYLEAEHGWLISKGQQPLATNSLQLVKQLALAGSHVALTSELDAAPEIIEGRLVFVPIRDSAVAPQTIAVVINARRSPPKIVGRVSEALSETVSQMLAEARAVSES